MTGKFTDRGYERSRGSPGFAAPREIIEQLNNTENNTEKSLAHTSSFLKFTETFLGYLKCPLEDAIPTSPFTRPPKSQVISGCQRRLQLATTEVDEHECPLDLSSVMTIRHGCSRSLFCTVHGCEASKTCQSCHTPNTARVVQGTWVTIIFNDNPSTFVFPTCAYHGDRGLCDF